jgi:aminoglycoside phosphotransferase (APT) family kinase protein
MALRLTDGTTITDLSEPLQGMRHRIFFGVEESSGREVAAKVELIEGALGPERRALEWLTEQDVPAPRLLAAGTLDDSGEHPGAVCLVVDRVAGGRPTGLDAWNRLGGALARLSLIPWEGSGLRTLDHDAFRDLHERRVAELAEALGRDLAAGMPPLPRSYASSPMTVTHGDPGPGNFLDDGADGTLIDWEDAVVAPRGLDLGRARFIALLGSGPEGWVAEEPVARADAVAAGFLAEVAQAPDADELAWWLGVAGVQFAYWRRERAGAPGVLPWLDAVAALDSALPATD